MRSVSWLEKMEHVMGHSKTYSARWRREIQAFPFPSPDIAISRTYCTAVAINNSLEEANWKSSHISFKSKPETRMLYSPLILQDCQP